MLNVLHQRVGKATLYQYSLCCNRRRTKEFYHCPCYQGLFRHLSLSAPCGAQVVRYAPDTVSGPYPYRHDGT